MAKKGETGTEKASVISAKALKDLLVLARRTKNDVSELAGQFGSAIKAAVENKKLHRKAFRSVIAEDRMEPEALREFYDQLEYYRDVLGLTDRAKNAPRLPMAEDEKDEDEKDDGNVRPFPKPTSVAAE